MYLIVRNTLSFENSFFSITAMIFNQWRCQSKNLEGAKMFDFRRITLFFWKNASQRTKWLRVLKFWEARALWLPLATLMSSTFV